MNIRRKLMLAFCWVAIIAAGIFIANAVFAQVDTGLNELGSTGLTQTDPRLIIAKIIKIILSFLGIVFLSLIIYGGFLWMTAGGSDQKQDKARKTLTSAIIGVVIVLAAYAITTFVITKLGEATGANIAGAPTDTGAGGTGGVGGEGGGTGGANFYVKSFMPKGKVDNYNVTVSVLFNKEVKANSVGGNFTVRDVALDKEVAGKVVVAGAKIIFTPDSKCAEDATKFCFAKDTQYEIVVGEGLRSATDTKITCSASFSCKSQFTTGALFDNTAPKVSLTYPGAWLSVKANSILTMQAKATDNIGVLSVDFLFDDKVVGADQPKVGTTQEFDASYDFDLTGVALGKHLAQAKAQDLAANAANSSSVGFYVKSESCFNAKDELICGKPECGACDGGKCTDGSQCASGECDKVKGVCVDLPIITSVSPAKGGRGNFVTISGKYFDDFGAASKVEFQDGKGAWVKAELGCGQKSWTKSQIIAVVPSGAGTGPVRVTNKKGYVDTTSDERGWKGEFIYDENVAWPGLCSVVNALGKTEGKYLDLVTAEGSGFGDLRADGDNVYFGEFAADISGTWQDKKVSGIKIPNLKTGTVNVKISNNNVLSNAVGFAILESTEMPSISSISPSNGGKGQYVTITGAQFGDSVGQVQFIKEDDPTKYYVAEFGCSQALGAWTDTQIVVKVPSKIPASALGKYAIQIVKGEVKSNQVLFDVNAKAVTPGICYIKPSNGPAGTKIEIGGEEFGASQGDKGEVVFYSGAAVKEGLVWANGKISGITVPQAAKSGPVYIINSDGLKSNEVTFSVGSCSANSCGAGQSCCNGLCLPADECKVAGMTSCEYAWTFSTGLLPIYPEVLEIPTCSKDYPASPSPAKAAKNACPNAEMGAVFNTLMDNASFIDNVVVSACNSQKSDCDLSNCSKAGADCHNLTPKELGAMPFEFRVVKYQGEDRTQVALKTKVQTNLKYRVTLIGGTKGVKSATGLPMAKSYYWEFMTGENNCNVDHILISPSGALLQEYKAETTYLAQCVAKNCDVITCPEPGQWQWGFSNEAYASSRAMIGWDVSENFSTVKALAETDANKDIEIFSVFKSLDPKQPGEHSDTATLKIQFLDPAVVNSYPTCNSACPNSLIYAQFNTSMAIENDWSGKVNVFPCLSAACTTFAATGQLAGNAIYNEETKTVNFILKDGALLLPNTYYRAIIDAGIFSTSKKALADSYSWKFKTKDGAAACAPQKVEVWPKKTTSFKKGEFILYQAAPMGDPAGCDSAGDFLAPNAYSWSWESLKPTVAMISTDQRNVDFPKYCDAKCRVKGSVSKDTAAICGDGKIEIGEECDDSNAKDGDGCSAKCLNEGTIACVNLKDANCCGNSIKDKGESCDDGNAKDGDGCGAKCLNEGSTVAGFICGNGKIEYGEDCDDSNMVSGDGCNSQCLAEGAAYVVGKEPALCGNGKVESGEECETGAAGCSKNCVWAGTTKCAKATDANCCGNVKVDPGEECEIYDAFCTSNCLKMGSVASQGAICGNGKVEPGEDAACEPAIVGKAPGNFYQMAKVIGDLPADVLKDTTNILAYPWSIDALKQLLDTKQITAAELTFSLLAPKSGGVSCEKKIALLSVVPSSGAGNVCPNVSVVLQFNQAMDLGALIKALSLKDAATGAGVAVDIFAWNNKDTGFAAAEIIPKNLLGLSKEYSVVVGTAATGECGQNLDKSIASNFTVGNSVCKASQLIVDPSYRMFNKAGDEQEFKSFVKANNGEYIHEVAGQYEWALTWKLENKAQDIVGLKTGQNAAADNKIVAFAKNKEGLNNSLVNVLEVTKDTLFGGSEKGKALEGAAIIDVVFCDKPWFWNSNKYFNDPVAYPNLDFGKYNIQTFYCRDGKDGDQLPLIKDVPGSINKTQSPVVFYEVFFVRDPGPEGAPYNGYDFVSDAVSLRVAENPGTLPVDLWYKKFVPNPGGPQSINVDGYQAIKDGRTIYVSAANANDAKNIYNNIYIISYTDKANANTLAIVTQLMKYWRFNTNVDALVKQMAMNDTKRVNDAAFAKYLLDAYFGIYKDYPHLDAGSYIKNLTYSVWPSWQDELGKDLQNAMPEDPQNRFATVLQLAASQISTDGTVDTAKYQPCNEVAGQAPSGYCEKALSQCLAGTNFCRLCPVGYDVNTCYDSVNKKFSSQAVKYQAVYSYKYLPASKACQFSYYLESEALLMGYQYIDKPVVCK